VKPIGVFDSGIGGLTVVSALQRWLPHESILYLGDTARLPYGTKSAGTVERYTRHNVDFLVRRGVKAVVVACNTASALALPTLTAPVPVWGVIEPGAAEAAAVASERVGVIATEATIRSNAYPSALQRHRPELPVLSRACPMFVPLVEEGWVDDEVAEAIARRYLTPLLDASIDALVLGCTHYPLLAPLIARIAGPAVRLVDSAEATAKRVAAELLDRAAADQQPRHHFCVTDAGERFEALARRLLDAPELSLEWVDVGA
jgi:glutamate racemase